MAVGDVVDGGERGRRVGRGAAEREELGCPRRGGGEAEVLRSLIDQPEQGLDPGVRGHRIGDEYRLREVCRRVGGQATGGDVADACLECTLLDHIRPCRRHLSLSPPPSLLSSLAWAVLFLLLLERLCKEPRRWRPTYSEILLASHPGSVDPHGRN